MTVYACEKCIHRYPLGGCLVPSNLGYVEQCKHLTEEPKPHEMTNEEWFTSLSTEEKARFLDKICYSAWGDRNSRFKDMADYTDWIEWLKEKHDGNM